MLNFIYDEPVTLLGYNEAVSYNLQSKIDP